MKKRTILIVGVLSIFSLNTFGQDMGGPPPKKKTKSRSEIASPTKQEFSDVQKKYQNKIVFSNAPVSKTEAEPSTFVTTWEMGDPLYFRVFHSNSILEGVYDFAKNKKEEFNEYYFASYATLTVVYINGKEMATREEVYSNRKEDVSDWVTYSGYIYNPDKPKKTSGNLGLGLKRAIHAMGDDFKEQLLDVKIELYAVSSVLDDPRVKRPVSDRTSLLSSGELKVKVTKDGMKKYAPVLCYDIMKNGESIIDPILEDKVMVQFSKTYGRATAANIVNSDWNIKTNAYGTPVKRNISTMVTYYDKSNNHNIIDYYINQPYDGSGGYQNVVQTSSVGASFPFSPYCISYKKTIAE
tara:strand:+ start:983 stop:2041 length:1059 start_codon:yes stop_codon:yes gene_type:complete